MSAYRVLKLIKKREMTKGQSYRPHQQQIKRLAEKTGYTKKLSYDSLQEIVQEMKEVQVEYAQFRPRAHEFRESYLGKIVDEMAEMDGKGVEHHLKISVHRKWMKEHFTRIKLCEARGRSGGVDKVDILE